MSPHPSPRAVSPATGSPRGPAHPVGTSQDGVGTGLAAPGDTSPGTDVSSPTVGSSAAAPLDPVAGGVTSPTSVAVGVGAPSIEAPPTSEASTM